MNILNWDTVSCWASFGKEHDGEEQIHGVHQRRGAAAITECDEDGFKFNDLQ